MKNLKTGAGKAAGGILNRIFEDKNR